MKLTDIELFPNPTNGVINVEVEFAEIIAIKVYAIDGKELKIDTSSQIDLSNYSSGAYFIRVQTNKGMITQKVIKE